MGRQIACRDIMPVAEHAPQTFFDRALRDPRPERPSGQSIADPVRQPARVVTERLDLVIVVPGTEGASQLNVGEPAIGADLGDASFPDAPEGTDAYANALDVTCCERARLGVEAHGFPTGNEPTERARSRMEREHLGGGERQDGAVLEGLV